MIRPTPQNVKTGATLVYDDGRDGHQQVKATVLHTDAKGMLVQFEDRADTTTIRWSDRAWLDFLTVSE